MNHALLAPLRADILNMQAYTPSPLEFPIKLDAMESPYSIPQMLQAEWNSMLGACPVNRYPAAEPTRLIARLREHFAVPPTCDLLMGNGSDELIQMVMLALGGNQRFVLAPEPGFVMYPLLAKVARMRYWGVALDANFNLDQTAMLDAMQQSQPALICLAQPNNPTGNLWEAAHLEEIIANAPAYVLLDEAYAPFADSGTRGMDLLNRYENLLVLRTFSKIGFAGLRCGFLIGQADIIRELNKVRLPYNIGSLVQGGIAFILKHYASLHQQIQRICVAREQMFQALSGIPGLEVFPSQTNFILFRTRKGTANFIFDGLKENGILIKNMTQVQGLKDCLRVSIGCAEENQTFLENLKALMAAA